MSYCAWNGIIVYVCLSEQGVPVSLVRECKDEKFKANPKPQDPNLNHKSQKSNKNLNSIGFPSIKAVAKNMKLIVDISSGKSVNQTAYMQCVNEEDSQASNIWQLCRCDDNHFKTYYTHINTHKLCRTSSSYRFCVKSLRYA